MGAISAAWAPGSTARSIASSATTVLPEPTSPISSRCIGRSRARSASTASIARALVAGRRERQRSRQPARRELARRSSAAARAASRRRARRRSSASWSSSSSSKASRRRPPSWSPKCAASSAAGRSGSRSSTRSRAGSGSSASAQRAALLAHEREDLRRREPLGGRVGGDLGLRRADGLARSSAWACTRKRLRASYLPCSTSRVPGRYLRSSHGWLKNVAFIGPVASATIASTSGRIPRRRTGRLVIERTSTTTVAVSPGARSATVRASRRSRGRCSSRSPTVCSPRPLGRRGRLRRRDLSGAASRDGRG